MLFRYFIGHYISSLSGFIILPLAFRLRGYLIFTFFGFKNITWSKKILVGFISNSSIISLSVSPRIVMGYASFDGGSMVFDFLISFLRGLPPFFPFSRDAAVLRSDFAAPPLRPIAAAAEEIGVIHNFWPIVCVSDHQWPSTSACQVADISPGNLSNLNARFPSFQYAARWEFLIPPLANAFASSRFLTMICFIPRLLSHNLCRLIAQVVGAAIFFQFRRIRIHPANAKLRNQSFQFVSFFEVHFFI